MISDFPCSGSTLNTLGSGLTGLQLWFGLRSDQGFWVRVNSTDHYFSFESLCSLSLPVFYLIFQIL